MVKDVDEIIEIAKVSLNYMIIWVFSYKNINKNKKLFVKSHQL